jgi:hypothetical protein
VGAGYSTSKVNGYDYPREKGALDGAATRARLGAAHAALAE